MLAKRPETAAEEAETSQAAAEDLAPMFREYNAARRYTGTRVARSSARSLTRSEPRRGKDQDTFASAMSEAVIKELKGTTGRRIVRGILGGFFKGR